VKKELNKTLEEQDFSKFSGNPTSFEASLKRLTDKSIDTLERLKLKVLGRAKKYGREVLKNLDNDEEEVEQWSKSDKVNIINTK